MKDALIGKRIRILSPSKGKGFSTLEIMIAFAIITLSIAGVAMVFAGNQSVSVDTRLSSEGLSLALRAIEQERALAKVDFNAASTTATASVVSSPITYASKMSVFDISPCAKQATSTVTYTDQSRPQTISLATLLVSTSTALSFGGDCSPVPPTKRWDNPTRFASDTTSPGKPTALDELDRFVYLSADKSPFFYIASTSYAMLGQSGNLFVTFANGFSMGAEANYLDAVRMVDGAGIVHTYIFAAMNTSTKQLKVIDVTNPLMPVQVASSTLAGVSGAAPQGWIVEYYKNRLYITTRFTAGPEFHIFDVSNPVTPLELGSGTELGMTADGMFVRDQVVDGTTKRFAYLASDQDSGELQVYDVTDSGNNGTIVKINADTQDFSGSQDGQSVFAIGNKLYFGRLSTPSGSELYIYDISNPTAGLAQLGSVDIGTGVLAIKVAGAFAFISTPKTNNEFQIWNISSTTNITNVAHYNFGNIVNQGIDYDPDFIYSTGQSTPNFQIIYSPT